MKSRSETVGTSILSKLGVARMLNNIYVIFFILKEGEQGEMALSRDFKETVMEFCKDPEYRRGLLLEALESYLEADIAAGHSLLRDYLNGTQSFAEVANQMLMKEPGLRRMLGSAGNPTAKNIFRLIKICNDREGIDLHTLRLHTN